MTMGWSVFVTLIVASNILGCVWLLWWTSRRRPGQPAADDTSHVWDGDITEYNKPLPRWWINLFYLTIVFSIAYLFWFGGWGSFRSASGWTSVKEHAIDKSTQDGRMEAAFAPYRDLPIDEIARDPRALQLGQSIFAANCSTCHGSGARGAPGFPDLTDNIWHWGGHPQQILTSVLDGREGIMTPWGKVLDGMGGDSAVLSVAVYVQRLATPEMTPDEVSVRGERLFQSLCVACHGPEGKGNIALGAPDLTDRYWMYGGRLHQISESIENGRHGVMPPHRSLIGETRSRLAAAYVWSLSHGDAAPEVH